MANYKDYGFPDSGPSHTFYYLQQPVMELLEARHDRLVLDLGCGNGSLVRYLLSQGYDAYGTDASEEGIKIAQEACPGRFFLQDLSSGGLPPELQQIKFDTIISTEVIEHLYDPAGFIGFCKACLPTGGELIISTPYHGYLKNLLMSVLGKWDAHLDPSWAGGHIKFWSRKTLSRFLENNGFNVVGFKGCGRIPYFWKSMLIKAKLP